MVLSSSPPRGRALLVEDDPALRTLLSLVLEDRGFQVDVAAHGREALDKLRFRQPDVIVTDLRMPTMNGWEFLRAVRTDLHLEAIPIIVTTALPQHLRSEGRDVGAYLTKPFDLDDFFSALDDVVKPHQP